MWGEEREINTEETKEHFLSSNTQNTANKFQPLTITGSFAETAWHFKYLQTLTDGLLQLRENTNYIYKKDTHS